MDVLTVMGLSFLAFILVSAIMPWINFSRIRDLEADVRELRAQMREVLAHKAAAAVPSYEAVPEVEPEPDLAPMPIYNFEPQYNERDLSQEETPPPLYVAPVPEEKPRGFERQFGARLPVWIGGIALAAAGFFLVKYSIDIGLLTQSVRVTLGGVFGLGLLYAGHRLFNKPEIADHTRIGQSVVGAGIADLYVCLYAATSLYHLLPSWLGFAGMGLVTLYAVIAALQYGAPIALMGLVGGFLTPTLIHSAEPSAPLLFLYLYFVLAGVMAVARAREWWVCNALAVSAAFVWVIVWLVASPSGSDGIWIEFFLVAIAATVIAATKSVMEKIDEWDDPAALLNYLALGGTAILMAATTSLTHFDSASWVLFWCLSLGGLGLAWMKPRIYDFMPWLILVLNLCLLLTWRTSDNSAYALTLLAFGALNVLGSRFFVTRSERPVLWAAFGGAALLAYYLLGYYELHDTYNRTTIGFPFWGLMALALGAYAVEMVVTLKAKFGSDDDLAQKLMAIHAIVATAFLSLGLWIELPRDFLQVAFATEVLAVSLIDTRVRLDALRLIALILTVLFAALLIPQILLLVQLTAYSLFELELPLQASVPIVSYPLFQLGLPAALFAGASYLLRRKRDDGLVQGLETAAVGLLGLMGYYVTRHLFHIGENVLFSKASFAERGVITNILFAYGIACIMGGRRYRRGAIVISGAVLCAVSLFRLVYFDFLLSNPFWSHQFIGTTPLLNALALTYGLPIIWLYLAARELKASGNGEFAPYTKFGMLVCGFAWASLSVTQFYHGGYLDSAAHSDAEFYSYSAAWLLLGVGLLVAGTARRDRLLRTASLAIMLLTVGKVFLLDASQLDGLYRVFSFLGLGLSLLGLSWFYTRFVFNERGRETKTNF